MIVLSSLAGLTYAQGDSQRNEILRALTEQTEVTQPTPITLESFPEMKPAACFLPDGNGYPLNTVTLYNGQRYRCVEVFAPTELLTLQSDADGKRELLVHPGR